MSSSAVITASVTAQAETSLWPTVIRNYPRFKKKKTEESSSVLQKVFLTSCYHHKALPNQSTVRASCFKLVLSLAKAIVVMICILHRLLP